MITISELSIRTEEKGNFHYLIVLQIVQIIIYLFSGRNRQVESQNLINTEELTDNEIVTKHGQWNGNNLTLWIEFKLCRMLPTKTHLKVGEYNSRTVSITTKSKSEHPHLKKLNKNMYIFVYS